MSSFEDKNQFKRISFQPPNKIMNITCGKLIESKIFSKKQKEKREGKSTKLKRTNSHHQQQNEIDESFTFQMTRKLKCDYRQRNTSLYLYFLLLAIDPTAKVVLRRNLRDSKKQHTFKTYGCDSIESRNQCIYSKDFRYKLTYDEEHNSNTIDFDELKAALKIIFPGGIDVDNAEKLIMCSVNQNELKTALKKSKTIFGKRSKVRTQDMNDMTMSHQIFVETFCPIAYELRENNDFLNSGFLAISSITLSSKSV